MADVTELRCWPSCPDAVDWSQDGIIILASHERVELLFPNTESFDTEQEVAQWRHIPLQVPWFSSEELPVKEPAPLLNYSIGEEISSSHTVALAWSPPGLAKHRRSAFAALTANLVLSIWSADGKPQEETSWDRRLILNHTLTEYFMSNATEEISHLVTDFDEKVRLRARVRAFAWAPTLPQSGSVGTQLAWGPHILAISNDDNQIIFVAVDSPTSTMGLTQDWSTRVIRHFALNVDSDSIFSEPAIFDDIMAQQRFSSHIAWSPWAAQGDSYRSVLAYATNKDVRARTVTYSKGNVSLGDETVYPDIEIRHSGPMKWAPKIDDDGTLTLVLFTIASLVYLRISGSDASILKRTTRLSNGRWDPVTGVVWDLSAEKSPRLHFCSLTSTMTSPTAIIEISANGLRDCDSESPNWRDHIANNLTLFSEQNNLKGHTKAKLWGLSASPLGDFIVACHSVHPSDMIEYGPPSDRRSTVAINSLRQNESMRTDFPAKNVSAEGITFTLKNWMENTVDDSEHFPAFANEVLEKLLEVYGSPSGDSPALEDVSDDLESLVTYFKRVAFLDHHTLKDRFTNLVYRVCLPSSLDLLPNILIAFRLALALQKLPEKLSQSSFSSEVLTQHRNAIDLIRMLIEEDTLDVDADDDADAEGEEDEEAEKTPPEPKPTAIKAAYGADNCDFCDSPIPFTDLSTARCTKGHQFPRCGLTFLAIQAPGITKYCGICNTPVLSDEFILAQEQDTESAEGSVNNDESDQPRGMNAADPEVQATQDQIPLASDNSPMGSKKETPVTLARVLTLACDVCLYCGGRFVG